MAKYITFPLNDTSYAAEEMQLWHSTRTSGVFATNDELQVTSAGGMNIKISPGGAWLSLGKYKGVVFLSEQEVTLTVNRASSTLNRIDLVVIRYDNNANVTTIEVKQGTSAVTAVTPSLTQIDGGINEIAIAKIIINRGVVSLVQSNIQDTRLDETLCGIVSDGIKRIPTNQLNLEFRNWLDNLRNQLDTNQAANLMKLIVNLQSEYDKNKIISHEEFNKGGENEQIVTKYANGEMEIRGCVTQHQINVVANWGNSGMYYSNPISQANFMTPFANTPIFNADINGLSANFRCNLGQDYNVKLSNKNTPSWILSSGETITNLSVRIGYYCKGYWK